MASRTHVIRNGRIPQLGLVVAALLLASCTDPAERPGRPVIGALQDAGPAQCSHPDEGCPCAPGTEPVTCYPTDPVMQGGRVMCQTGTRVCRDSAWSACEDITLYAPSGNKILGAPGSAGPCAPDQFTQDSTPDGNDLTPGNSTNLENSNTPTGVRLETIPPGNVVNYGLGPDSDGDGVPDTVDDCPADVTRWRAPCTGPITEQGFFHILPPGATAMDPMNVNLTVKTVDTYLLIDTTNSMSGEIANLRAGLTGLMANVQSVIPGSNLGVGMFREFPVAALQYQQNDFPYMHLLDPTSSLTLAQRVVNQALDTEGNSLWPEAGAQALYSVASGRGLGPWVGNRSCPTNASNPNANGFGWPCFRSGTVPVVIVITDAPFWNGPSYAVGSGTRYRSTLTHNNYPNRAGTTTIASARIPQATVVSGINEPILTNDTEATAFDIGDVTNRSITIHGSNNGVTTPMVNNFTEACGGRTPSGPDVYYTFTLTQPRHFVFEAYADFDPTLYFREVSGATATTRACDLDTGRINDGNGTAVWRTGSKIDTRLIPGSAAASTSTVQLDNCNAAGSDVGIPMTGCTVTSQTTNATLSNCTIPSTTTTSNLSNCQIMSSSSQLNGCTIPSNTVTDLTGCTLSTASVSTNLTSCSAPPTSMINTTLTGCSVPMTSTPGNPQGILDRCYHETGRLQASFTGCSVSSTSPPITEYSSCTRMTRTPQLTGCINRNGNVSLSGCGFVGGSGRTQIQCNYSSARLQGYAITSGSTIPAGTTITQDETVWDDGLRSRLTLSAAVPGTAAVSSATVVRENVFTECRKANSSDPDPVVGHIATGSAYLRGSGTDQNEIAAVRSYACGGSTCYGISFVSSLDNDSADDETITSGPNYNTNTVRCTSRGTNQVTPAAGMAVSGNTGVPGGATVTGYSAGGGAYDISVSSLTGSPTTLTVSGTGVVYGNVVTCSTRASGYLPSSTGWRTNGTPNVANSVALTGFSGTGPFTFTLASNATGPVGSLNLETTSNSLRTNAVACDDIEDEQGGFSTPQVGMLVTSFNVGAVPSNTFVGDYDEFTSSGRRYHRVYLVDATGNPVIPGDVPRSADNELSIATVTTTYGTTMTCTGFSGSAPVAGMTLTNGSLRSMPATTISGSPTASGGGYIVTLNQAPTAQIAGNVTGTYTGVDLTRLTCTVPMGGVVPQTGWAVSSGMAGLGMMPTITSVVANGGSSYTITMNPPATAATITSVTTTGTDRRVFTNCLAARGPTPTVGDTLTGNGMLGSPRTAAVVGVPNGAGRFSVTMNEPALDGTATLTQASNGTPRPNLLRGCSLASGTAPSAGLTVTGLAVGTAATPVLISSVSPVSGMTGIYDIVINTNANATGVMTNATATGYTMNRFTGCTVTGDALAQGMLLAGTTNVPAGTLVNQVFNEGGTWGFTLWNGTTSVNATGVPATVTSASATTTNLRSLQGCTLVSGSLVNGMGLAGARLAAGTVVSGAPVLLGNGTWNLTIDRDALSTGLTNANGTLTVPLPELTGCTGSFVMEDGTRLQGAAIAPGTTVTSFGGLGVAGNTWTLQLSQAPTATGVIAVDAMFPGPSNRLTGCMIRNTAAAGQQILVGMTMSGALIAGGSTVTSVTPSPATGYGTGPYELVLSDDLTGTGPTDASGILTTPPAPGTGRYPIGLPAGTYQLVVDSGTFNSAGASSPGRGTFQLRLTNISADPAANPATATQAVEVPWATTISALNAAGVKTIGIASCPGGCSDLAARQTNYATCVQGATPTLTSGADSSTSSGYCGRSYQYCNAPAQNWGAAACTAVFTDCRQAEVSAGQQRGNVQTSSCTAARAACNRVVPNNTAGCTALYNSCLTGTAVCSAEQTSVTTCLNTTNTSNSDAAAWCDETLYDLEQLGRQTGSVRDAAAGGTPFVYQIPEDGSGLSATIADGVRDLARYILFDVTAQCEDPNGTGACGTLFDNAVIGTPSPVGQVPGCNSCSGATCLRCTPGSQLPYQINFENSGVAASNVAQTFEFFIVLRDATGAEMSRAPVRIVVPPDNPSTVAPTGSFRQIYDATLDTVNNVGCPYPGRRADWGTFTYSATIPAGTNIRFEFRTANTIAGLASATPVSVPVTATAADATVDIGQLLVGAGLTNYLPYLQVIAVLNADSSLTRTPVLQAYNMQYTCVDIE